MAGTAASPGSSVHRPLSPADQSPPTPAIPAPGVYVYGTTGFEEVDAFRGVRHDYPPQTTITVVREACGVGFAGSRYGSGGRRGRPARHHRESSSGSLVVYHGFAGGRTTAHSPCDAASLSRPADTRSGTRFGARCPGDNSTFTATGTVVGVESATVGGESVETVHVQVEWRQTGGDVQGVRRLDQWLLTSTGLLVRQTYEDSTEGQQGPVKAHCTERYELRLVSLTPRQ